MRLVSLLPGPIELLDAAGQPRRLAAGRPMLPELSYKRLGCVQGVPIVRPLPLRAARLPPTERGVLLVVPRAVRDAHPERMDLASLLEEVSALEGGPLADLWLHYNETHEDGGPD